jgi:hypothetical protein
MFCSIALFEEPYELSISRKYCRARQGRALCRSISACNIPLLLQLLLEKYKAHGVPRSLLHSIVINTSYSTVLTRQFSLSSFISILFFRSIDSDVLHDIDRSFWRDWA